MKSSVYFSLQLQF